MNRFMVSLAFALLATLLLSQLSVAQQPAAQSSATSTASGEPIARLAPGTTLRVELEKTIDAKKVRSGDVIIAKTMDDLMSGNAVVAPKGLKVVGHVTAATVHEHESPSTLSVAFDKLIWKDGTEVPLNVTVQAIGRPESYGGPANDSAGGQMQPGGVPMGGGSRGSMSPGMGVPSGAGYPPSGNAGSTPTAPSGGISGQLPINAQGVVGMPGVTLMPGSGHDSVISSQKHNVKLDSGTQMVLRVS